MPGPIRPPEDDSRMSSNRGFVLIHPERGVYVGRTHDLTFWSKLDGAGRDAVATFENEATARVHIEVWEGGWIGDGFETEFRCHPVTVDVKGGWASIAALRAAGLADYLGELAHAGWRNAPGRC
jgi:hypothetical protein